MAKSNIGDLMGDSRFQPLIPDPAHGKSISNPPDIKRVIYYMEQVYMALAKYREAHNIADTAVTRIEQLHPFP